MKKQGLGIRDWGLEDEGLHAASVRQHQALNLSLERRRCRNLRKEFFFDGTKRECL
jgi:hypothetical protein